MYQLIKSLARGLTAVMLLVSGQAWGQTTRTSEESIQRLGATYAALIDEGKFKAVADLLKDAKFTVIDVTSEGKDAIYQQLIDGVQIHENGTPKTWHVNTNYLIEVDETAGTATSSNYFTVFQTHADLPLQAIVTGKYHDKFKRENGEWKFVERFVQPWLIGDLRYHVSKNVLQ